MSYGLAYTLPFRSIDGRDYRVEIERDGYTGEAVELKGQSSPFTVEIGDEEFVYTPTRFSTATLHLFGSDYLQDLFSTDYRAHRVTLYEDDVVVWCGFVTPELYTQDYRNVKFELDMECCSAMSVLEYVEYSTVQEGVKSVVSLWDLLRRCIEESRGRYTAVYVPHVYGLSSAAYNAWTNPLLSMSVSEQDFFDEDGTPMKMKEVLEEIMKLLGWTCVDWAGSLYFVDIDNDSGEYYRYSPTLSTYTKVQAVTVSVQDIGFSGSDHSLDIVPGYNKATVRVSNYPVGDALPNTDLEEEDYLTSKDERAYQSVTEGYKVTHHRIYRPDRENYKMYAYKMGDEPDSVTELTREEEKSLIDGSGNWMPGNLTGAIPHKYDEYNEDSSGNADITDYDYDEEIYMQIRRSTQATKAVFTASNRIPVIRISGVTAAYSGGAFAIDSQLIMYAYGGTVNTFDFHFSLRIGNYYYHGKSNGECYWNTNSEQDSEYDNNLNFHLGNSTSYEGPYDIVSSRSLNDGLDDVKGYICRLPEDRILLGDLELIIYAPAVTFDIGGMYPSKFALTGFSFSYNDYSTEEDTDSSSDRIYENVVNENYINDLDEIEFKISSFHEGDGACYSKVLVGDNYLTDNLYCGIVGSNVRPEEFLIRRIVDHYSATKIRLTQVIKNGGITPVTILTDRHQPGKGFVCMGGNIDYKYNSFSCKMIETSA